MVSEKFTTISTVGRNSKPESALIAFVEDESLRIYFQTGTGTRKFTNLKTNGNVAFVIGFGKTTVQYEGIAKRVEDTKIIEQIKKKFVNKNSPTTKEFLNRPIVSFFEVMPTWIGYSDYSTDTPIVSELKF